MNCYFHNLNITFTTFSSLFFHVFSLGFLLSSSLASLSGISSPISNTGSFLSQCVYTSTCKSFENKREWSFCQLPVIFYMNCNLYSVIFESFVWLRCQFIVGFTIFIHRILRAVRSHCVAFSHLFLMIMRRISNVSCVFVIIINVFAIVVLLYWWVLTSAFQLC